MQDNTMISLVSIGAGVAILITGMVIGNTDAAIVGIAGTAIGVGAGVSIPVGAKKE